MTLTPHVRPTWLGLDFDQNESFGADRRSVLVYNTSDSKIQLAALAERVFQHLEPDNDTFSTPAFSYW